MKTSGSSSSVGRLGPTFSILIAVGILLAGLGGRGQRAAAQIFPPRADDTTPSMGVFRVIVAPAFSNLFAPAVGLNGYPGYHSADARLTSPVLIDPTTIIGRSDRHNRLLVGSVPV